MSGDGGGGLVIFGYERILCSVFASSFLSLVVLYRCIILLLMHMCSNYYIPADW